MPPEPGDSDTIPEIIPAAHEQDHLAVKHVMQSGQASCMLSLQSCRRVDGFRISVCRTSLIAMKVDFKALLYCPTTAPKEI